MQRVTRAELDELAPEWDAIVAADPDIDPVCSRSAWQLAFHDAFEPQRPLWLGRSADGLVVLAESRRAGAPGLLEPLENMWGFGSPLIGPGAAALLARMLRQTPRPVLLLGLPVDQERLRPLAESLGGAFVGRVLEPTNRYVASLAEGLDAWLADRSRAFRRNLRVAARRSAAAEIELGEVHAPAPDEVGRLYLEMLAVEARSWKGLAGRGADEEPMRSFYGGLLPRLAERGELRVLLAEQAGRTVGYLHGALVDGHFRGLQFSFDESLSRLGLGNLMQHAMLRWLCDAGAVDYDLGGQSAYKARWGEVGRSSLSLLIEPGRPDDD